MTPLHCLRLPSEDEVIAADPDLREAIDSRRELTLETLLSVLDFSEWAEAS